jgi:hypothetical protein
VRAGVAPASVSTHAATTWHGRRWCSSEPPATRSLPGDSSAFGVSVRQLVLGRLAPDEDGDSGERGSPRTVAAQQRWSTVMMGDAPVGSCTYGGRLGVRYDTGRREGVAWCKNSLKG